MKPKIPCAIFVLLVLSYGLAPPVVEPGMMGHGMGPGMTMGSIADSVPEKLPAPGDRQWLDQLRDVLALEKLSFIQYTKDAEKFNARMPYRMVIPQERDHIEAIRKLFSAYGAPADGDPGPFAETKSLAEAYERGIELERGLAARYEKLIETAPDKDSAAVLNNLLLQTRHHLVMFEHALRMGGNMGPGMMRGPGMGM
ncbi:MAG: hypothetical protein ABFD62_02600 [Syntrophaceae bacterium]